MSEIAIKLWAIGIGIGTSITIAGLILNIRREDVAGVAMGVFALVCMIGGTAGFLMADLRESVDSGEL